MLGTWNLASSPLHNPFDTFKWYSFMLWLLRPHGMFVIPRLGKGVIHIFIIPITLLRDVGIITSHDRYVVLGRTAAGVGERFGQVFGDKG